MPLVCLILLLLCVTEALMFSNGDSFDSLMEKVLKLFPNAFVFSSAVDGEIVIHTGWCLRPDGLKAYTPDVD